ncbi:FtsX-like permease family protein [Geodermatophilus sp. CPCC 206100]|uniref:FtsX-like permease family protein n=1 Tax=Geodermatophilus sp. CPCC 206100 TaxID=3020054 RepID=UPI003AFF9ADC
MRWRLALRIAARDARRHRGRTLLIVLMVGLPVLAVTAADTLYRTTDTTPVEALPDTLGASDAVLRGEARARVWADPATGAVWQADAPAAEPPWTRADVAAALPAGSRVVERVAGGTSYRTETGHTRVSALAGDLADPLLPGGVQLQEGRLPAASGEVAVSRQLARRGIAVGDELLLTADDVPAQVVGVVTGPAVASRLVLPLADAALLTGSSTEFFARVPGGLPWPAVQALNAQGLVAVSREVVLDPPPEDAWLPPGASVGSGRDTLVLALIVVAVVLEVALLAGPAFAVGVRRQRRDLALVAVTGGAPGDLRRVVLASGLVVGGSAAVLGAALGIGLAAAAVPVLGGWDGRPFGPFDVAVADVLAVAAVGVLAALGAVAVPAARAARLPVVASLAGRRGPVRTAWRLPLGGLLVVVAGLVVVALGAEGAEPAVAGGAVLLVLGAVAATPWLLGLLAPAGRVLPAPGRLALRDAVRNRSRTAPAVAAVMATVAGVTALAIGSASDSAQMARDYLPLLPLGTAQVSGDLDPEGWAATEAAVRSAAPGSPVHALAAVPLGESREVAAVQPGCTGALTECRWLPSEGPASYSRDLVVADAATLRAAFPGRLDEAVGRALDRGRVVVFGTGALAGGEVTLAGVRYDEGAATPAGEVRLPAVQAPAAATGQVALPALVVVPPSLADRLPLPVSPVGLVVGTPADPVTPAVEQRLTGSLAAVSPATSLYVERGWSDRLELARLLLVAVAAVLVLIATVTATGLALTDARPDFATLAALGAAPRTRRTVAMSSAAVVAGVGAGLGVLVGLVPGIAVARPLTRTPGPPLVDVPWLVLAAVAVGVPLLAVLLTGLFVRSRLPMVPRLP